MSPNFSSKLLSFRVGGALFSTSRLTSPGGEVMKRCFSISLAPLREVLEVRAWCASTRQEHGRVSPRVAEVGLTGTGMSRCKHTEVWAQVSAGSAHAGLPQAPLHSTNRSDDLQSCGCSGFLSNFAKANTNMLPPLRGCVYSLVALQGLSSVANAYSHHVLDCPHSGTCTGSGGTAFS